MGIMVFVRKVDQFLDTALDDGLGAFVAGEQRHIHPRPFQVVVGAVQDGVQLGVADVHILGLQVLALALPGHLLSYISQQIKIHHS